MSTTDISYVHFGTAKTGSKKLRSGTKPPAINPPPDRIPRIARLMALAIHFDGLIRCGKVRDYAELARMGGITRARVTQIMGLLNLAPEIQEKLLFLPGVAAGRDAFSERNLRAFVAKIEWAEQRRDWLVLRQ